MRISFKEQQPPKFLRRKEAREEARIVGLMYTSNANGPADAEDFYGLIGPKLVDLGYSAIPIEPGTKRPGRFSRGKWSGELNWQRFCDRLPTEIETDFWSRNYHDAGV